MEVNYEKLLQDSNNHKNYIQSEVSKLPDEILTKKASVKRWSALEVVEHLNLVYDIYLDNFDKVIQDAPQLNGMEQKKQSTILGRLAIYTSRPKNRRRRFKVKTFDFFRPVSPADKKNETINRFLANKTRFNGFIKEARLRDLTNVKIPTALGEKIKFYVPECFEFLLAHEERHMLQIEEAVSQ